jgi:hypothetical protein
MRGGLLALVVASLLISAAAVIAKPYVLNCTTDTGEQAADLTVDLDQMVMTWGMAVPNYIIDKITDRYITGLQKEDVFSTDEGKEVFVLDRVTGQYKKTHVGLFCKDSSCRAGNTVLRAFAHSGKCVRPMF